MNDSWLASGELLATGARDSRCCSQSLGRTTAPAQGARGPQALRLLVATGSLLPRDQPARSSRSCGPHGQMGWPRLSPRGGGLLPVASTLSSVLRHLRNRATVSSSSSSCECAALCRATPSAHQTARAQHATHGSKRRAIARRFHFGLRGTREFQSLTRDDTLRSQHKTHSLRSQLRPHTLSATSRPPCGREYP